MRLPVLFLPLLLTACAVEPVRRNVELTPDIVLPAGFAMVGGNGAMLIAPGEVEPLSPSHAYVAWASTATDSVYLGSASADAALALNGADVGLGAADIEQIRLTIEDAAALPLDAPSAPPVLEATVTPGVSATLSIPGISAETLANGMATAVLEDSRVEISSMGLPLLPSALFYGAWLEFDPETDAGTTATSTHAGHAHTGAGHGSAGTDVPTLFAGALDPAGALKADLGVFVGRARAMTICIEADHGVDPRSPTCVLRGSVVMPSGTTTPAPAEHVH